MAQAHVLVDAALLLAWVGRALEARSRVRGRFFRLAGGGAGL